jgi:hypothetical protein
MGCGKSVPAVSEKLRETNESKSELTGIQPTPVTEPITEVNKEISFKPIHSAIRWNKPVLFIEALLTSSAAVNCPDNSNGNCPVHIAAQNGHIDIIRLLILKKADLNVKNVKGNTGIHMAVGYDYFEVAKMLIAAGGDENMLNDLGIPAHLGLEGDKAMGIAALVSAETAEDVEEAFSLCEAKLTNLNKINFVSAGLKAKKGLGVFWTSEHQNTFKSITSRLS